MILHTQLPSTEWSAHLPTREGGPNATSCIACHNAPIANGAGDIAVNVLVDPAHTGDPRRFLERNTLPLLALGVPQRLAEEMTQELFSQRDAMVARACQTGNAETVLVAKTIAFGSRSRQPGPAQNRPLQNPLLQNRPLQIPAHSIPARSPSTAAGWTASMRIWWLSPSVGKATMPPSVPSPRGGCPQRARPSGGRTYRRQGRRPRRCGRRIDGRRHHRSDPLHGRP